MDMIAAGERVITAGSRPTLTLSHRTHRDGAVHGLDIGLLNQDLLDLEPKGERECARR